MHKSIIYSLLALAVFAGASAAEAGTKKIKLDANELESDGTNSFMALGYAIVMPDAVASFASVPVVLPPNYKKNSQVTVRINYAIGDTGCAVAISPAAVLRVRKGKPLVIGETNVPGTGLVFSGNTTVNAPATETQVFSQAVQLSKATVGEILDQKAGDTLTVLFVRVGNAAPDTCTNELAAVGATVTYETK